MSFVIDFIGYRVGNPTQRANFGRKPALFDQRQVWICLKLLWRWGKSVNLFFSEKWQQKHFKGRWDNFVWRPVKHKRQVAEFLSLTHFKESCILGPSQQFHCAQTNLHGRLVQSWPRMGAALRLCGDFNLLGLSLAKYQPFWKIMGVSCPIGMVHYT